MYSLLIKIRPGTWNLPEFTRNSYKSHRSAAYSKLAVQSKLGLQRLAKLVYSNVHWSCMIYIYLSK